MVIVMVRDSSLTLDQRLTSIILVVTENCRRVKGVWLCFGGGGSVQVSIILLTIDYLHSSLRSYSGYGRVG